MSILRDHLFIFEMANNHQGSVEHGLRIVDAMGRLARRCGIRAAVKLQYRDLDSFIHPAFRRKKDVKHVPRFLSTRLTDTQFLTLVNGIRDEGLTTMVTPFDEPSVEKCIDHGVQIIKVASCSADDWPLLEAIAQTQKPVIVSTGGLRIHDIDNIVSFFSHHSQELALMHCVALYPTPPDQVQMGFVSRMARRYPQVPVGYSGHESPDNLDVVKVAISKGAQILERHVGVPAEGITLNRYSMAPEQAEAWVQAALAARQICGEDGQRRITQEEMDSLRSLKRGVYARTELRKRSIIKKDDVFFAMPCQEDQTTSGEFGRRRATFRAGKTYLPDAPVTEHREPDTIAAVRAIIHDAKGMIFEAGVVLGNDFTVEISHHYGIEHFRHYGILIVNMINREYCKKIIVVLAGQQNPRHHHKRKEETFQLLWGELHVRLNEQAVDLKPGDKLLIERGAWHSFSSRTGCVFEEVSTTHFVDDSFYEDETISALDPIERKTAVRKW